MNKKRQIIERHRWVIQNVESGLFLGFVRAGELLWVESPADALQHCQMEVACNNLWKLREYYKLQEDLRIEPVLLYADISKSYKWHVMPEKGLFTSSLQSQPENP